MLIEALFLIDIAKFDNYKSYLYNPSYAHTLIACVCRIILLPVENYG